MPRKMTDPKHATRRAATATRRRATTKIGFTVAPLGAPAVAAVPGSRVWADLAGGERLVLALTPEGDALRIMLGGEGSLRMVALTHGYVEVKRVKGD